MVDPARRLSVAEKREPVRSYILPILRSTALLFMVLAMLSAAPSGFASSAVDDLVAQHAPLSRADLERLYQYKLDRGAANLSIVACFLIRASKRFLQERNISELRVDLLFLGLYGYLHATITNYIATAVPLTKMLVLVLLSVLCTIAAFSLVSLCKYGKLLAHDLGHLLPAPVPRHLALCCTLLALCLPLFLACSIIITALYWLLVLQPVR
ncbi:MAG: hypothetical protein MUC31_08135 [Bacteroidales bacterium]|nr:hypothetical protein [Bacteroidales bacterium]